MEHKGDATAKKISRRRRKGGSGSDNRVRNKGLRMPGMATKVLKLFASGKEKEDVDVNWVRETKIKEDFLGEKKNAGK